MSRSRTEKILFCILALKNLFFTCKILDFFNVKYKKILFAETTKKFSKEVYDEADLILTSEIIEQYSNESYGKHIPLIAYYVALIDKHYPNSVIWVGAANVDENVRYAMGNADHSDAAMLLYSAYGYCEVYSCVNCLSEFDIYRLVKENYGYDDMRSIGDNPDKEDRINAFVCANELYKLLTRVPQLERLMMFSLDFNMGEKIFVKKPSLFDFRSDIRLFLSAMNEF